MATKSDLDIDPATAYESGLKADLSPEILERFRRIRQQITRALDYGEEENHGPLSLALHPNVIKARHGGRHTKVYYALMRHLREASSDMLDIGSSIEVDNYDFQRLCKIIESSHAESIRAGHFTSYPSSWGIIKLRKSIADFFGRIAGIELDPEREVMVTAGIMKAVDSLLKCLDIDALIVPTLSPFYVYSLARLRDKKIIPVPLDLKTGVFDLDALQRNLALEGIPDGRALFYMTLPSAPAGTLPPARFVENALIPFVHEHKLPLVCDTYVYATTYQGRPVRPLMSYVGARDVAVEAITVAKEFGLPGIRIGGLVGNRYLINHIRLYGSSAFVMLSLSDQNLAANALNQMDLSHVSGKLARELSENILPAFKRLHWPVLKPQAGLDLLIRIPPGFESIPDPFDRPFYTAICLLLEYGVGFCPVCECDQTEAGKWLRVVLKQGDGKIQSALQRLEARNFNWRCYRPNPNLIKSIGEFHGDIDLTKL